MYQNYIRHNCYHKNDFLNVNEDKLIRDMFENEDSDNEILDQRSNFTEITEQSHENINILSINAFEKLSSYDINIAAD